MGDDFFGCDIDLDDLDEVLEYKEEEGVAVDEEAEAGMQRQAALAINSRVLDRMCDCVTGSLRSAMGGRVARCWEIYTSKQVVWIHAPPLQVPLKVMQLLATFGGIVWICWNMKFLKQEAIHSPIIIKEMSFPQKNFYQCHDVDIDCDDINQTQTRKYCELQDLESEKEALTAYFFKDAGKHNYSKSRWPQVPQLMLGCGVYDMHDIFRKSSEKIMLTTAFTKTSQTRCNGTENCIWRNSGFEVLLVDDVERFFLKLRHVVKLSYGDTLQNEMCSGFLQMNQTKHLLACEPHKKAAGNCGYSSSSHEQFSHCGDMTGDRACFTTGFADFLSLRTILDAANISLDDGLTQNVSRRWWGTHLSVDIEYSNVDPWNYWNIWHDQFLKLTPIYTYSVRKSSDYAWHSHHSTFGNNRDLVRMSGIVMLFHLHGTIYHRSWMHFLKTLAIFTIIWEITMVVVAHAVLFIYRRAKCLHLDHLPYLRSYFRQMKTPHHRIASGLSYADLAKELQDLRKSAAEEHLNTSRILQADSDEEISSATSGQTSEMARSKPQSRAP